MINFSKKITVCKKVAVTLFVILIFLNLFGCKNLSKSEEYTDTRFLMDTVCTIRAKGTESQEATKAAFDRINDIAQKVDYFSDDSEVTKINNATNGEKIQVSDDTAQIIKTALSVYKDSDGAFDITTAPIKDLWKFSDGNHLPPSDTEISDVLKSVGSDKISIDGNVITKKSDNTKIDLGAAAKGYALDCAKEVIKKYDTEYALIDLGGSISTVGDNPKRKDGIWIVGLQKPFGENGEYSQTTEIKNETAVTSGIYQRYFVWDGKSYHHILNPKTGYPAETEISGVTIIASSGLIADCLSTAYMVLGEEQGNKLAEKYNAKAIVPK